MKRSKMLGAVLVSLSLAVSGIVPQAVMADTSSKVVTLGADLTQEQMNTMLRYFKVNPNDVEILYINNQDERDYLSSWIPLSQIGNRTVSCAYVKPTQSGGIKVRTANLNYVTCNMIASTLATSGVSNCEVVAACPFEVSGTGALTGITKAYEKASGEQLDERKKQTAVQELVVTENLANKIDSSNEAMNVINSGKMEVIGNDIQNADEIYNVVVNIVQENNLDVPEDTLQQIVDLLQEIADQDYNYEEMEETLQNVESNVSGESLEAVENGEITEDEGDENYQPVEDSILDDLDPDALGEVFESSTEDPTLEVQTAENAESYEQTPSTDAEAVFGNEAGEWTEVDSLPNEEGDVPSVDEYMSSETEGTDTDAAGTGESDEDELNTEELDETELGMFDHARTFCDGEYKGNLDALQFEMGLDAEVSVILDTETAEKLTKEVLKMYLEILKNGTEGYIPMEDDLYMTPELNMIQKELTRILLLEDYTDPESYLNVVSVEDRKTLFDDTMKFFEKLYNEVLFEEEAGTYGGESADYSYTEASMDEAYDMSWDDSMYDASMEDSAEW